MPSWLKHPTGSPSPSTSGKDNLRISLRISMGEKSPIWQGLERPPQLLACTALPPPVLQQSRSVNARLPHPIPVSVCIGFAWPSSWELKCLQIANQAFIYRRGASECGWSYIVRRALPCRCPTIAIWENCNGTRSSSHHSPDKIWTEAAVHLWWYRDLRSKRHFHTPIDVISYKRRAILSCSMFRKGRIRWFAYIEPDSRLD